MQACNHVKYILNILILSGRLEIVEPLTILLTLHIQNLQPCKFLVVGTLPSGRLEMLEYLTMLLLV
jgi:hypothetical protein